MESKIKTKLKFAWTPVPGYHFPNSKHSVWLKFYYKVYKWMRHTWAVNDPNGYGWTWIGNSLKKENAEKV